MDKLEIIKEIKRITNIENGKVPGFHKFSNYTGLKKSDWYPNFWLRWGDALKEAGFDSNQLNEAYDNSFLIEKYIELIDELGHFPIEGEIRLKGKNDKSFPSHTTFGRLGSKPERAKLILEYCNEKNIKGEIISFCEEVINQFDVKKESSHSHDLTIGYVYLIKHGSRNEFKIGKTFNPLRREGEIRLQLPEKITPIHYIETDDPSGVEAYWHNRFKNKRKEGEWFLLLTEDIKAFKRWKRIF